MSVNALAPKFGDKEGYQAWRKSWRIVYRELSKRIRLRKNELKAMQRKYHAECEGMGFFIHEEDTPDGTFTRHSNCACGSMFEGGGPTKREMGDVQRELILMRRDATKMMTLLKDAKDRRDRIVSMQREISEQPFPLELTARTVDVHYNRGHNEFSFLPRWVVKANGKSFYVDHIESSLPWSTRELDTGSTKGMLRFRKCRIAICPERIATLVPA